MMLLFRRRRASLASSSSRIYRGFASKRVAIVGSGPSGFYTAKYLLAASEDVHVTMLERWPTPYGLVRFGVAPDHPEVKSVEKDFAAVASSDRFTFFGNVVVGDDADAEAATTEGQASSPAVVPLGDLMRVFPDGVVLACGADEERSLGVPGESLEGVHSARRFVAWYNSEPLQSGLSPFSHLGKKEHLNAVVVGHGNVALDVARYLASLKPRFESTDLSREALDALYGTLPQSRDISVVGRRGSTQSAFTIKELRELTKLPEARLLIKQDELNAGDTQESLEELHNSRALTRKRDLMDKFTEAGTAAIDVRMRFLLQPVEFKARSDDPGRLGSVVFERCALTGEVGSQQAVGTGDFEELPCDLALVAVGYRARPPPLDNKALPTRGGANALVHSRGRVLPGLYCTGWLKRGPSGIIGSNIADAKETANSLAEDLKEAGAVSSSDDLEQSLLLNGATSWGDWAKLDAHERALGQPCGAPRIKLSNVDNMLNIIKKGA